MSHRNNECRIYVGNLPPDIRTKDIQDLFHKFGKVTFVDLKNRRGPPFAFVEFEDSRYVYIFEYKQQHIEPNVYIYILSIFDCAVLSVCLFRSFAWLLFAVYSMLSLVCYICLVFKYLRRLKTRELKNIHNHKMCNTFEM